MAETPRVYAVRAGVVEQITADSAQEAAYAVLSAKLTAAGLQPYRIDGPAQIWHGRTVAMLADTIIAALDCGYDLVYVDRGDRYTDAQVAAIVRGDDECLDASLEEWQAEQRWHCARQIIAHACDEVIRSWLSDDGDSAPSDGYAPLIEALTDSDDYDRVLQTVYDRDRGQWPAELARLTPDVLLRIGIDALDEDHALHREPASAVGVLTRLGIPVDAHNGAAVQYALDNANPESSILMGYWIITVEVGAVLGLPSSPDTVIEIDNPHLYLGNPAAGYGFITEQPLHGAVRVRRGDLRTDRDAFGHAVAEIYGGLDNSEFTAVIRALPEQAA